MSLNIDDIIDVYLFSSVYCIWPLLIMATAITKIKRPQGKQSKHFQKVWFMISCIVAIIKKGLKKHNM